jgi:serine/threonine-protein kinase
LEGLPVKAQQGTFRYRSGKFMRRHKVGVAAVALVFITVLSGIAATLWQARKAKAEQTKTEQVSNFLVKIFQVSDPSTTRGNTITAREILARGAQQVNQELSRQPEIRAVMLYTIGKVYQNLGLYQEAIALQRESLTLRRALLDPEHPEIADSCLALARSLVAYENNSKEAELLLREALRIYRAGLAPDPLRTAATLHQMAEVERFGKQNLATAETLYREALEIRRQQLTPPHYDLAESLMRLAGLASQRENLTAAEPLADEALRMMKSLYPEDDYRVGDAQHLNGIIFYRKGDYATAATFFRQSREVFKKTWPQGHTYLANSLLWSGMTELKLGRPQVAESLLRECLAVRQRILSPGTASIADVESVLGESLTAQQRYVEAEPLLQRSYQNLNEAFGPNNRLAKSAQQRLIALYETWGKAEKAAIYRTTLPQAAESAAAIVKP